MILALDISPIVYEGTGSARFTKGMVDSILKYDQDNQWIFFFSSLRRQLDPALVNKITEKGFILKTFKLPPTLLHYLWNGLHKMNVENLLGSFDWFITSDWTQPPSHLKIATLVHDLTFQRYPDAVAPIAKDAQSQRLKWAKKESTLIIASTQTTRNDLTQFLNILPSKIKVIYPGVTVHKPTSDQIKKTLDKFGIKKKFILSVGKLEPRKNLKRLVTAFVNLNNHSIDLVLIGPKGWNDSISQSVKLQKNIHILGYVSDEELSALFSSSLIFVYPTIWEGFGYPLVEAMTLGVPTAVSAISTLKEIAVDASTFFDPQDTVAMSKSMDKMIKDEVLRKKLIHKGLIRSRIFSWKTYYNKLIKLLTKS